MKGCLKLFFGCFALLCVCNLFLCIAYAQEADEAVSGGGVVVSNGFVFDTALGRIDSYIGEDENVVIPEKIEGIEVKWLGAEAFSQNKSIKTVFIPKTVDKIWEDSMQYYNSYTFYKNSALEAIYVDEANESFKAVDGVLIDSKKNEILCYPPARSAKEYYVPTEITAIRSLAFTDCNELEKVYFDRDSISFGIWSFSYKTKAKLICTAKSDADRYAKENMMEVVYFDNLREAYSYLASDAAAVLQKVLANDTYTMEIEGLLPNNYMSLVDYDNSGGFTATDAALILQKSLNSEN